MMQFSSATVQYRPLSDKETNPSSQIYDLYVQGLVRLLKMFSLFLIFYCCGILVLRAIEIIFQFPVNDLTAQLLWGFSIILHSLGIVVGIFGLRAVSIQSRGTSRNFFFMMILFDVAYLAGQGYYLYMTLIMSKQGVLKDVLGEKYSVNAAVYYLILTGFALIFMTAKSYRFHILLCKLIIKLKNAQPTPTGLQPILEIN